MTTIETGFHNLVQRHDDGRITMCRGMREGLFLHIEFTPAEVEALRTLLTEDA